jgi:hypothetical protein
MEFMRMRFWLPFRATPLVSQLDLQKLFLRIIFWGNNVLGFLVQLCLFQQAEQELSISGAKASFGILTPVLLV